MPAVVLTAVEKAPWGYSLTGVGLTWQEVEIPEWAWLRFNASDQVYLSYQQSGDPGSPQEQASGGTPRDSQKPPPVYRGHPPGG